MSIRLPPPTCGCTVMPAHCDACLSRWMHSTSVWLLHEMRAPPLARKPQEQLLVAFPTLPRAFGGPKTTNPRPSRGKPKKTTAKARRQKRWAPEKQATTKRRRWTAREDETLRRLVQVHGGRRWARIARGVPPRTPKQCRERWTNQLDPSLNHNPFTEPERRRLVLAHRRLGSRWSHMVSEFDGRSANRLKNEWANVQRVMKRG